MRRKITQYRVTLIASATGTALATPGNENTANLGLVGDFVQGTGMFEVDALGGAVATLTGPVKAMAKSGAVWREIGTLDGGNNITIAANGGVERQIMQSSWDDVTLVCPSVTGSVKISYVPEEEERK